MKTKLNLANTELDTAFQASRTHASELSRYRHLNEQLAEQLEIIQKDKRRISEELESASNQLLETQGKLADLERRAKVIEADRQSLQNDLEDARDTYQLEQTRNQNLQSQIEKLKVETEKKLAEKDDEIDMIR